MRKLSVEGLSNVHRVTQQMAVATSTQFFLSYPTSVCQGSALRTTVWISPSSSPRFCLLCCPLEVCPPGPRVQGKVCSMPEKGPLPCRHLQAPEARKEEKSRVYPCGSLNPILAGGAPFAKREFRGIQGPIIKTFRDARHSLPHKICKSHCSRAG